MAGRLETIAVHILVKSWVLRPGAPRAVVLQIVETRRPRTPTRPLRRYLDGRVGMWKQEVERENEAQHERMRTGGGMRKQEKEEAGRWGGIGAAQGAPAGTSFSPPLALTKPDNLLIIRYARLEHQKS